MSKIGLALSGGGARGLAHIGVLHVLQQEGIAVDYLAGTSMGGFIAAVYAAGMDPRTIKDEALCMAHPRRLWSLIDLAPTRRGLFEGHKVQAYMSSYLGDRTFADLELPLTLVAVDLNGGCQVHLNRGCVADAVRATVAIPGIFTPVERDGQLLVDGGVLNNLPVDVVRDMGADVVIAVDVLAGDSTDDPACQGPRYHSHVPALLGGAANVMWRSLELMRAELDRRRLEEARPEVVVQPPIPYEVGVFSGFTRAAEIIAAGEDAAWEALPRIASLLASPVAERAAS